MGHEHTVRHKLGYAKPAGLGSVRVQVTRLTRWSGAARYAGGQVETYDGETLRAFLRQQVASCAASAAPITLDDLRRIWQWPPSGEYQYPGRDWFQAHPRAPLRESP